MHSVSRSLLVAGIVALGGLTACGDKLELVQPTTTPTGKDSSVTSVTVTPSTAQVQVGGTQTFVASVVGGPDLTNRAVTWSSSDASVATVSAAGVATALKAGQTTIIAKSSANPSVQGAAVLTVQAIAPASLSFFGVNRANGQPAVLNNVNGQLNVVANVDPGQSGLTNVQLLLICPKATGTGSDTTVVGSSNVSGTTGTQTAQQVTIPFNTAAFNQVTGSATYRNGTCSLSIRGTNAAGAQVISATGPALTLNNADVVAGSIVGSRNATNPSGIRWDGGDVTVQVLPVFYSGAVPASLNVTISGTDKDAATTYTVTTAATKDANGVWTATFTEGTTGAPAAPAITNLLTTDALTASVVGVSAAGQVIDNGGAAFGVNTVPSTMTGAPVAASIRYDNENPVTSPFTFNAQNANFPAGGSGFINGSFNFSATPATAGFNADSLGTWSATCSGAAATNLTLCDHGGVDKVASSFSYTTANPAASTSTYTAITSASAIPETASGTSYGLRYTLCDALNNCTNRVATERFGVDLTAPTINSVTAPANNSARTTTGSFTIAAVDSASASGTTGAGFGATPVMLSIKAVLPSGSGSQITRCVSQNGLTAAQSPTGAVIAAGGTYAVPSTGCIEEAVGFGPTTIAAPTSGEYTVSYRVVDMAGNTTATGTRVYDFDAVAPVIAGGIAIPASVTSGTSFTASATDSVDIGSSTGVMAFTTTAATSFAQAAAAVPTGTVGDNNLTRSSTITYTPAPFYGTIQTVSGAGTATAPDTLDNIVIRARDLAGNTSGAATVAVPAGNVTTGTFFPVAATGVKAFTVDTTPSVVYNGTTSSVSGNATSTVLTADVNVGTSTGASPFSQVCFYYTSNGGAGQGGAALGELVLIGCSSAASVTGGGATDRIFTYSIGAWDPPSGLGQTSVSITAVGSNGNAGLKSTPTVLDLSGT